jgi:flagellar protein FliO/FliZ
MGFESYLRLVVALAIVLGMIGGAAWIVRRFGWGHRLVARAGERRLQVLEALPLDNKRRLVLLRRDGIEHLVLLGVSSDLLIEGGIGQSAEDGEFRALLAKSGK